MEPMTISQIQSAVISGAVKTVLTLLGCLPLGWARRLGGFMGYCAGWGRSRMARATWQNLTHCLPDMPEPERRQLAKRSLYHTGALALETAVVWTRDPGWVRAQIDRVTGLEPVQAALRQGRGVLVLAPHIGNWEVLNIYLASLGPMTNLYQPPKTPGIEAVVRACRSRCGASSVPTDRKGLLAILTALKTGGISGILPDQTPKDDNSGLFVPFFAHHAFTMTLAHKLITKSGCLPVFAYAKRTPAGFQVVFREVPAEMLGEDEALAVAALSRGIEDCVRALPAQYQWEYKRFKKRPPQDPDPYGAN
jgi:Kdo2-lipid IVA lauroyltransferase/acyltransferase